MRRRLSIISVLSLLFALLFTLAMPAASSAQIGVLVSFGPPPLPVYEQPVCPGERYIWTPGYWAWDADGDDYYWVPGTWVLAPRVGYLWTPGYWGWGGRGFVFYEGYWGPRVGFYGGINYGFGYFGRGYEGGRWDHDRFYYNREVNNVDVTVIHNVYNTRVENNYTRVTRVSYNGGEGGINERASREEESAARGRHIPPVHDQVQHVQAARGNPELRASSNHGKPPVAATPMPGAFHERGVVPAKEGGHYNPPARTEPGGGARRNATHPKELPTFQRPAAPNTGKPKVDQKYQQQQDRMFQKQEQDRQKLQQKQEQDHQRLDQKRADDTRRQQTEQHHQQQTQQLSQRHEQQQQKLQQKQQPPPHQNEDKHSNRKP